MFYRQFNMLFQDIIVVGTGGTGSRIIQPLVQTIKQSRTQLNPCLYLVDGDVVEHKNLSRQNFIERDVGRNKAQVLAERYGAALDFPIVSHDKMVVPSGDMIREIGVSANEQGMRRPTTLRKLIIMCVDSINARLLILNQCGSNDIIIDAGNEDTFGQVSIFDKISLPHVRHREVPQVTPYEVKPIIGEYSIPFIPAPVSAYLEALANPPAATGSCADLDQSLAINNMMAAGIINMVQNLAYNNKFYCRTNFFDLLRGNSSERMTNVWLSERMNERQVHNNDAVKNWSSEFSLDYLDEYTHEGVCESLISDINDNCQFVNPDLLAALGK